MSRSRNAIIPVPCYKSHWKFCQTFRTSYLQIRRYRMNFRWMTGKPVICKKEVCEKVQERNQLSFLKESCMKTVNARMHIARAVGVNSLIRCFQLSKFSPNLINDYRDARANQDHAFDPGGTAKPEPQQRRQQDGANNLQRTHHHKHFTSGDSCASYGYTPLNSAILSK